MLKAGLAKGLATPLDGSAKEELLANYWANAFDTIAEHNHFRIVSEERYEWFETVLAANRDELVTLSQKMAQKLPPSRRGSFLRRVNLLLVGRLNHWTAEGLKRVRDWEKKRADVTPPDEPTSEQPGRHSYKAEIRVDEAQEHRDS
jgi:hypothetical protein